ncbi:hypothetical protein F53441_1864 [Fusarium austroafricanum]|uniref:Uncharacterized protein n=1 Tax=Fusarium austroafricanum TaxID=2364996 RepID=A0A8H4P4L0_9HYPO|nr:hypothetical protein F53441_1864 [Fusarium austroafricanum]
MGQNIGGASCIYIKNYNPEMVNGRDSVTTRWLLACRQTLKERGMHHLLTGTSNDRYRPASLAGPSSSGRGMRGAGNYSSYYPESSASFSASSMPGTAIAYGTEYGHDSRQAHSFGGYGPAATMMYNVAQPSAQNTIYDAQQFSSRQPAAQHMMRPGPASTYFGAETKTSDGLSLKHPNQASGGSSTALKQNNGMNFASYQRQLGSIFQEIVNGSLEGASETLLSVTSWLLSQVADLGLNLDDTNLHADRIQLWDDFNHAWLGLGQRQIDLMTSSQHLSRAQSLVSKAMIKKMGNELIRLCDGIERHGLVDYQYGV